jgi:hypothetical protein
MQTDLQQYLKLQTALLAEKSRIEARLTAINRVLSGDGSTVIPAAQPTAKRGGARRFSAATKAKMAAAQKARWAKLKGTSTSTTAPAPKQKRKLSAAGRAAIVAATQARWAKIKAAKAAEAKPAKPSK